MRLIDLFPEADVLCASEPEELGLRMLPALADWRQHYSKQTLTVEDFVQAVAGDATPNFNFNILCVRGFL